MKKRKICMPEIRAVSLRNQIRWLYSFHILAYAQNRQSRLICRLFSLPIKKFLYKRVLSVAENFDKLGKMILFYYNPDHLATTIIAVIAAWI